MDRILSTLSIRQQRFVESSLSNDTEGSDEELRAHYIAEGFTEEQATQAIRYRPLYCMLIFLDGHTPILKGYDALAFASGSLVTLRDYFRSMSEDELHHAREYLAVLDEQRSSKDPDRSVP